MVKKKVKKKFAGINYSLTLENLFSKSPKIDVVTRVNFFYFILNEFNKKIKKKIRNANSKQ
jgi:hypothetical protein